MRISDWSSDVCSSDLPDVEGGDVADTLGVHRIRVEARAERETGEDRQLVRGIDAVDVEGRVGLGVAELLRLGQHVLEGPPRFAHRREDVVAGAVPDAVDAGPEGQSVVQGKRV